MPVHPEIFISAASRDLKSCRTLVRDALLTLGCVPILQDHFSPGAGEVRDMLRERIKNCHAVIHLAGECYGHEPQERAATDPRRSYTQLEYDIARELKKPLYTFLCAPDFPYDAHDPEPADLRALQDAHRAAIAYGDVLYVPIRDTVELNLRVHELQTRVEALSRDLSKTRSWLGRSIATALVALVLIGGAMWFESRRLARTEAKTTQVSDELDRYRQAVKALADNYGQDLELGRKLTDEEKFDRALSAVATRQHVGIGELKTWLALFVAQVRANPAADFYDKALADFAEKHFADAAANATKSAEQFQAQRQAAKQETLAAVDREARASRNERRAWMLVGDSEVAAGHYAASLAPYQKALALTDADREPLDWCRAAGYFEMSLRRMGRFHEAEPLARAVLAKLTILCGRDDAETLRSVNHLANVLHDEGDYVEEEALDRRCLEGLERTMGKDHPDTMASVNSLASLLYVQGDNAGAEMLFRRCLETNQRTLGKEHPATLASVNNLANVLADRADYVGAEALLRPNLDTMEHVLGSEHPKTLLGALSLAQTLGAEGNYSEAMVLFRHCAEVSERSLGKEHPDTVNAIASTAHVFYQTGDYPQAEALYRRCLETDERILGREHPTTLAMVSDLASVLCAENNYAEAEALDRRCLEAQERTLGKDHPDTLNTVSSLAQVLASRGDYAAAEPLYLRAQTGMEHQLHPEDPYCVSLGYNFSLMYQQQNRLADALPLAEKAAVGAAKSLPKDHPDRLKYEKNLADLRAKLASAATTSSTSVASHSRVPAAPTTSPEKTP